LCPGTSAAPLTKTQIQQTVFEELSSGDSVGEHFNQCSFNKTKLTMDNSMVADLVTIPCSGNTCVSVLSRGGATCSAGVPVEAAAARAQLPLDLSRQLGG
jgi:hypothetical protein